MLSQAVVFMALLAFPLGVAGFFISARRMGFYVDAIAHSAMAIYTIFIFLWMAWFGLGGHLDVWVAIAVVGILGAVISFRLFSDYGSREPWMGEVFVGALATAAIFLSKMPVRGIDFDALFMGQVLFLKPLDFQLAASLTILFALGMLLYRSKWQLFFVDRHLFRHYYGQDRLSMFVLYFLMSSLVACLVQSVGIILTFAWLMFPGRVARYFTRTMRVTLLLSMGLILGMGVLGLWVAYVVDIPAGPTCAGLWAIIAAGLAGLGFERRISSN